MRAADAQLTYSMAVSLDGYVLGPDGSFDWTPPDEEVFDLATDQVRKVGVHLLGGGTPFFPQPEHRVNLELTESRTFNSRVVYLRYRVAR